MSIVTIVDTYYEIFKHKNFPSDIDEMDVLISLIKDDYYDGCTILSGEECNMDGSYSDTSELIRCLNLVFKADGNKDFEPKTELAKKFINVTMTDNKLNLKDLSLNKLFSEEEMYAFLSRDIWEHYLEGYNQ